MATARPRSTVIVVVAVAVLLIVSCVLIWNTQNHEARIGLGWAVPAIIAVAATMRDLRSQPKRPMRLSFAVTDALFYFLALLTLLVIVFGWIFSVLGIVFGLPATALAWLARSRAAQVRADGAFLSAAMLVVLGVAALERPWTPSSSEWVWGAGVVFAAAALALGDLAAYRLGRSRKPAAA